MYRWPMPAYCRGQDTMLGTAAQYNDGTTRLRGKSHSIKRKKNQQTFQATKMQKVLAESRTTRHSQAEGYLNSVVIFFFFLRKKALTAFRPAS